MASDKPLITVVGSTSKQGYSVAKSLLTTGDYTVRALTRNPEGECARLRSLIAVIPHCCSPNRCRRLRSSSMRTTTAAAAAAAACCP